MNDIQVLSDIQYYLWISFHYNKNQWMAFFEGIQHLQIFSTHIALTIGVFQFLPFIYRKSKTIHFAIGNVYALLVLLLAAPTTFLLGFQFNKISLSILQIILGIVFWWTTRKAIYVITLRKWKEHIQYMIYSYCTLICIIIIIYLSNEWIVWIAVISITVITYFIKNKIVGKLYNWFLK